MADKAAGRKRWPVYMLLGFGWAAMAVWVFSANQSTWRVVVWAVGAVVYLAVTLMAYRRDRRRRSLAHAGS